MYFSKGWYIFALRSSKHSTNDYASRKNLLNLSTKTRELTQTSAY